ncbi:MAG: DNA-3-methyladenine glycosylase 2 family protein [Clostridiales bacterium]|nr:DNA-3-methyladenine glycosylase 2 family protein [Clostridiales bacterium]
MNKTVRKIDFFDPVKTALSGQAFRIHPIDDTHTEMVYKGRYLQIAETGKDTFAFSCSEKEYEDIWKDFFDLDRDYIKAIKEVDKNDTYLKDAIAYGYGIRILKQDIFETVISYIISQRRSIPSITTCVDRISELAGKKINLPGLKEPFVKPLKEEYYSFPTAKEILRKENELGDCGLGYRLPYVLSACRDFENKKITEEILTNADDENLYKILTGMYGVGTKVANCIMLFALHRTGRFPVDVWMQRIQDRYYEGKFEAEKYPETAGILQQFMFYYERTR